MGSTAPPPRVRALLSEDDLQDDYTVADAQNAGACDCAPYFEILIPLEGSPAVSTWAGNESEKQRLYAWSAQTPELKALLDAAAQLRDREHA